MACCTMKLFSGAQGEASISIPVSLLDGAYLNGLTIWSKLSGRFPSLKLF